jgi:F-type H+-transporting ATPase subunit gamma
MTRRRELEEHRNSLEEIGEILASMKTLAYMETRKLSRFLNAQQLVVDSINEVAQDFLSFHPWLRPIRTDVTHVFLVIGSERGFCGDFNRALMERLAAARSEDRQSQTRIVAVGHKLNALIEGAETKASLLDGASVVEEVPLVLQSIIDELDTLQTSVAELTLTGIYHDNHGIRVAAYLPPFEPQGAEATARRYPPLLNVAPEEFMMDLLDHYLFAALNHMLYSSLMAENQRRVSHLEGAVRHLEDTSHELTRKCRALRQEEIIEEIEVILLSASNLDGDISVAP